MYCINESEKSFYSKLYQRQQTNQNSAKAKRFLDNPSIANFLKNRGQVVKAKLLSKNVTEKTLGSFQTGKTPGNDGIPI